MGAGLETFLSLLLIVLLVIGGIALATKPFWKRIARFFHNWIEHDRLLEEQQRREKECRRKAQEEIQEYCHDDILGDKEEATVASETTQVVHTGSPVNTESDEKVKVRQ